MFEQQHHDTFHKYVSHANPIISKRVTQQQKAVGLKLQSGRGLPKVPTLRTVLKHSQQQLQMSQQEGDLTLLNCYSSKNLVYRKWDNEECRSRNKISYLASVFFEGSVRIPPQLPFLAVKDELKFSSNFESGNLFAAYKTGQNMYDLILQNDINTAGYTQWYYFKVSNTKKNTAVQLNIVNFYKSSSLYNSGMKPLVKSVRSERGWKRSCTSVYYDTNDILKEGSHHTCYKSLSFKYQFQYDDDQVLFAHSYPYDTQDLQHKLKSISSSPKVRIKSIGITPMKKQIPMIHITSQSNKDTKKAIILMARQHPGQTPASFILQQVINQILKPTNQSDFLLWRFDLYVFPMVNIDGVALGNYRGNAHGFDLNRCWQKQSSSKQPEVFIIKNQIKKIAQKQSIDMVVDFHGHSKKMKSFFYGNTFGRNNMIFPYLTAKLTPSISFQDSTFTKGICEKAQTARVVLGNLIKQTGSVYTYETTFYGSYKNGKKVHFNLQDYRELGRHICGGICKVVLEDYKEEKTLKESVFFKEVRKQLKKHLQTNRNQQSQCSDSQDQKVTLKQLKIKNQQMREQLEVSSSIQAPNQSIEMKVQIDIGKQISIQIQVDESNIFEQLQFLPIHQHHSTPRTLLSKERKPIHYLKHIALKNFQNISPQNYADYQDQSNQDIANSNSTLGSFDRKKFLMNKLRVFGETFVQLPKDKISKNNKVIQTNQSTLAFQHKLYVFNQANSVSPPKQNFRKKKYRNNSLTLKVENSANLPICDMQLYRFILQSESSSTVVQKSQKIVHKIQFQFQGARETQPQASSPLISMILKPHQQEFRFHNHLALSSNLRAVLQIYN